MSNHKEAEPAKHLGRRAAEGLVIGSVGVLLGAISVRVYDRLQADRDERSLFDDPAADEDEITDS